MTELDFETWVHKPNPVQAVLYRAGVGGNSQAIVRWLRSLNMEASQVGDKIVFDNGTDDLPIQAAPGDRFVLGDEDSVHRVKAHMWDGLYDRPQP